MKKIVIVLLVLMAGSVWARDIDVPIMISFSDGGEAKYPCSLYVRIMVDGEAPTDGDSMVAFTDTTTSAFLHHCMDTIITITTSGKRISMFYRISYASGTKVEVLDYYQAAPEWTKLDIEGSNGDGGSVRIINDSGTAVYVVGTDKGSAVANGLYVAVDGAGHAWYVANGGTGNAMRLVSDSGEAIYAYAVSDNGALIMSGPDSSALVLQGDGTGYDLEMGCTGKLKGNWEGNLTDSLVMVLDSLRALLDSVQIKFANRTAFDPSSDLVTPTDTVTSGYGIVTYSGRNDSILALRGLHVRGTEGNDTAIIATGYGAGHGMFVYGGSGASAHGAYFLSQGVAANGVRVFGSGTGAGIYLNGGTNDGGGIFAAGGGTNGSGFTARGVGTGHGFHGYAVGSGHDFYMGQSGDFASASAEIIQTDDKLTIQDTVASGGTISTTAGTTDTSAIKAMMNGNQFVSVPTDTVEGGGTISTTAGTTDTSAIKAMLVGNDYAKNTDTLLANLVKVFDNKAAADTLIDWLLGYPPDSMSNREMLNAIAEYIDGDSVGGIDAVVAALPNMGTGAYSVKIAAVDTSGTDRKIADVGISAWSTDLKTFYGKNRTYASDSLAYLNLGAGDYAIIAASSGFVWVLDTVTVSGNGTDTIQGYDVASSYPTVTKTCAITGTILGPVNDTIGGIKNVTIKASACGVGSGVVDSAGNIFSLNRVIKATTNTSGQFTIYVPYTNYLIPPIAWRFTASWPGGGMDTRCVTVPSTATAQLKKDSDGYWVIE